MPKKTKGVPVTTGNGITPEEIRYRSDSRTIMRDFTDDLVSVDVPVKRIFGWRTIALRLAISTWISRMTRGKVGRRDCDQITGKNGVAVVSIIMFVRPPGRYTEAVRRKVKSPIDCPALYSWLDEMKLLKIARGAAAGCRMGIRRRPWRRSPERRKTPQKGFHYKGFHYMVYGRKCVADWNVHFAISDDDSESIRLEISRVWTQSCGNTFGEQDREYLEGLNKADLKAKQEEEALRNDQQAEARKSAKQARSEENSRKHREEQKRQEEARLAKKRGEQPPKEEPGGDANDVYGGPWA